MDAGAGARVRPTVGIVGGGQLARMLAPPAVGLGIRLRVLAADRDEGADGVVAVVRGDTDDLATVLAFAEGCDVVTFDHERVPVEVVRGLEDAGVVVRPGSGPLGLTDKLRLRHALVDAGLPTPAFAEVRDVAEVAAFAAAHGGWPVVLKAARDGYDGKGVWVVEGPDAAVVVLGSLPEGVPAVVEPRLRLDRELAVLVARRPSGGSVVYPCVETRQVDGICHEVLLPADVSPSLAAEAEAVALGVADLAGAVGVLAVELFVVDGRVLVNELAPRPHNSGHLTIDTCRTSQFENHLRAVVDWPLGSPEPVVPAAAMANLIAGDPPLDPRDRVAAALALGDVDVHVYDKTPRPGRKLGHVTTLAPDLATARSLALAASAALGSVVGPGAVDHGPDDHEPGRP